ncbi:MAG: hypothetical protein H0X24_12070 [Ktedonobacterales bacterium]|nr:hypothetical protein [Ktedonobacterales bacterium]
MSDLAVPYEDARAHNLRVRFVRNARAPLFDYQPAPRPQLIINRFFGLTRAQVAALIESVTTTLITAEADHDRREHGLIRAPLFALAS